jgi:hypothetical protein
LKKVCPFATSRSKKYYSISQILLPNTRQKSPTLLRPCTFKSNHYEKAIYSHFWMSNVKISSPSCEATQPPTPMIKLGFFSLSFLHRPSW